MSLGQRLAEKSEFQKNADLLLSEMRALSAEFSNSSNALEAVARLDLLFRMAYAQATEAQRQAREAHARVNLQDGILRRQEAIINQIPRLLTIVEGQQEALAQLTAIQQAIVKGAVVQPGSTAAMVGRPGDVWERLPGYGNSKKGVFVLERHARAWSISKVSVERGGWLGTSVKDRALADKNMYRLLWRKEEEGT